MAAVKGIESQIFRQRVGPVRPFARDEGVHSFLRGPFQFTAGAARDDANLFALSATAWQQDWRAAQNGSQLPGQSLARNVCPRPPANVPPFLQKKRLAILEAERGAQESVVAQAPMRVQREVRTVNGQIVANQKIEHLPAPARPRYGRIPKQPVMHDHKARAGGDGQFDRGQRSINAGGDFRHGAGILDLQAVDRAVPIGVSFRAESFLAVADDSGQGRCRHGAIRAKTAGEFNAGKIFATLC